MEKTDIPFQGPERYAQRLHAPGLASWIIDTFGVDARAVRQLSLRNAKDSEIYRAAREVGAVIMTKDSDFVTLLEQIGPPPQILWITCGNTSTARLREFLNSTLLIAVALLERGEPLVEISDARGCPSYPFGMKL